MNYWIPHDITSSISSSYNGKVGYVGIPDM
jgi:hypothetical protein